jgi:hypothetical protein
MSSMTFWESKDPNDIDDFALDWTNQLKGEQLTAAEWSFVNAAGAAIEASSVSSPFALVRLSGGIENATAILLCRATTSTGRQIDHTVKLSFVTA